MFFVSNPIPWTTLFQNLNATSDADAPLCAQIHDISQDWLHQAFFQLTSAIDKDELNITFYRMI